MERDLFVGLGKAVEDYRSPNAGAKIKALADGRREASS